MTIKVPHQCPKCEGRKIEVEIVVWGVWYDGVFEKEINADGGFDCDTLNRPMAYCPKCDWQAVIEPEVRKYG